MFLVEWEGASCVEVGRDAYSQAPIPDPDNRAKRSTITGFSRESRKRMLHLCAKVKRRALARSIFVTLTYPTRWADDPAEWKRDLDTFTKALLRAHPGASVIWRLEAQERGAPHYHLLVLGVKYLPHEWVAETWSRIVRYSDEEHRQAGTETRRARAVRQAVSYVSKYAAKLADPSSCFRASSTSEEIAEVGRHWGVVNRAALPLGTPRIWRATRSQSWRIREAIAARVGSWFLDVNISERRTLFWWGKAGTWAAHGAFPWTDLPPVTSEQILATCRDILGVVVSDERGPTSWGQPMLWEA